MRCQHHLVLALAFVPSFTLTLSRATWATPSRSSPQSSPRATPREASVEAPRRQQFEWGTRIAHRNATVESILCLFEAHGHEFSARNLATTAHRVAKLGSRRRSWGRKDARMRAVAEACRRRASALEPRGLANTAWAFATAGVRAPTFFDAVAAEALMRLGEFNPQELANAVWAFATAGVKAPELFDDIAAALPQLDDLKAQELANPARAFAPRAPARPGCSVR
mmetsp:Transcript_21180/g.66533  ORF Transcript_21180/g.66533 Transcript_21180/m.66533 type:complete len:224 (+) Transcript_21180:17-688(+)